MTQRFGSDVDGGDAAAAQKAARRMSSDECFNTSLSFSWRRLSTPFADSLRYFLFLCVGEIRYIFNSKKCIFGIFSSILTSFSVVCLMLAMC